MYDGGGGINGHDKKQGNLMLLFLDFFSVVVEKAPSGSVWTALTFC